MRRDLPLPEGPNTNLLRLVVIPHFMDRSKMSGCNDFPVSLFTILMPKSESGLWWLVSSVNRRTAYSMGAWKLSSAGKSTALLGIATQWGAGRSMVLWRGTHSMLAS